MSAITKDKLTFVEQAPDFTDTVGATQRVKGGAIVSGTHVPNDTFTNPGGALDASDVEPIEKQLKQFITYDINNNPTIVCEALPGTSILAPAWRIKQLSYDGNQNIVAVLWALGNADFDKVCAATQTGGAPASAAVRFNSNPNDGDTVTIGTEVYEFDNNASVAGGNIAVPIGGSALDTAGSFAAAVVGNSLVATFSQDSSDIASLVLALQALVNGPSGNTLVIAATSSGALTPLTGPPPFAGPYTGFFAGGIDQIGFYN